jgi:hypothetical protein
MRELGLPPSDFGSVSIPDSIEVITGIIERLAGQPRLLRFGGESHLRECDLRQTGPAFIMTGIPKRPGNDVFVCHFEEVVRRFRFKFKRL